MSQTLRRELRVKFSDILEKYLSDTPMPEKQAIALVEELADAALELRGFSKPVVNLKNADPAWAILAGAEIKQEEQDENIIAKEAADDFERQLGFGILPWNSDTTWTKFYKFVVKIYKQNQGVWMDYAVWREGDGKYGKAMTNTAIRKNPQMFMDTGYPTYEASKMYRKDTQPEYKKVQDVEETNAVPNPYQKPAILRKKA